MNLPPLPGKTVRILTGACGSNNDINAVFSDDGTPLTCNDTSPTINGTIQPEESLSSFKDESIEGTWTLTVSDTYSGDGGAINTFSLNMCVKPDLSLPPDNFTLKTTSETCRSNQDGSISIEAQKILDYRATLTAADGTETTESFNYFWKTGGLDSGNYNLCITVEGFPNYKQCFDVVIDQPEELSVSSMVNKARNTIDLELRGAEFYTIELNGITTQTSDDNISLDLNSGKNTVRVTTDKNCQGEYKEEIHVAPDNIVIYPNPFTDTTRAFIGNAIKGDIQISIFNLTGQRISSTKYNSNTLRSEIELKTSTLTPGIYLIKIKGEHFKKTYKVVKL